MESKMEEYLISFDNLKKIVDGFIKEGSDVISISKNGDRFVRLERSDDIILNPEQRPSDISAKEFLFPRAEPIFFYCKQKESVEIIDKEPQKRQVLIGLKPCDAASFGIMHRVFNWDYRDEFFNRRYDNTLIIGLACKYVDDYCFCTSVNISPTSTRGSDLFLIPLSDGRFVVQVVTDKGKEIVSRNSQMFEKAVPDSGKAVIDSIKGPQKKFDSKKVKEWLDKNFETDLFNPIGDVCLGCGQCAFVCPTCHCFDIVDEDYRYGEGRRMKNWDSCQFYLFTLHASGHNPRDTQAKRYRQRVNHKFKYYIDRFGEILCTGCGRCSRGCPVAIDIGGIVTRIENLT